MKTIIKIAAWMLTFLLMFSYLKADEVHCNHFWGNLDFLYWQVQDSPKVVPLVIEGPTLAVPSPVINSADTSVVLGKKKIDTGWRPGGKVSLGCWLDNDHCYGAEASYLFLPGKNTHDHVSSNGSPNSPIFLLVPFYNAATEQEDSTALSSPLLGYRGKGTLKLQNWMQGIEVNFLATLSTCDCRSKFTGLAGFRYWNFNENLTFKTSSPYLSQPNDIYKTKDKFLATNNFYGFQAGVGWEYNCGCLSFTANGKIAMGAMHERVLINGRLITNDYDDFGAPQEFVGGYFALPTNIGKHSQIKFAAIPEINFNIGYKLCDCINIRLGYTFMYVTNMVWASNQIDRKVNPSQATTYTNASPAVLSGQASPKSRLKTDTLWAQGLQVGLALSF